MPPLSSRAVAFPSSPIRKLAASADAAKKRGARVFHLNIGQPDIETPPEFFRAIQEASVRVLEYSPSPGISGLRQAIADYYHRLGYPLDMSQVIVTTGASEAIVFAFSAILNPNDEVIVPEPYYANYSAFALQIDAKIVPIATSIEQNFALPDVDAFRAKITPRTKAIMICNPGNPTGVLYPRESLEKLKEVCREHNLYLISDEVYREFTYDGLQHHSVLGLTDLDENTIVVDSISKRFSACGARIGCLITRNEALLGAINKFAQARLSPPTLGQIGAQAVYQLPPSYFAKINQEYAARRDTLKSALQAMPGVVCPEINGAFYAMVGLPIDDADRFCKWILDEFEYEGQTVMMAPGPGFYATPNAGRNQVRIAYVLQQADLRTAMSVLSEALNKYAKQ
ncbi:MAG: pyridoxal phosphate-dependent aminotransferase [Planctomycetaceae bacterium]|jgi:aspartate aminotransferase|nr:pyridoxal phosphate-dependent aminotransferase [Planctomycetaceae bacterium]